MPVLTFVHERLTIACFLLIKPRASPVGEKALFFMHEAQAEWCLRTVPSPEPVDLGDAFDLPGQAPDAADAPPPPPSPPSATPAAAAASSPPLLRILPIPDSPESPWPEVEPDDPDETHLVVDGNDDPGILLVSPSRLAASSRRQSHCASLR